jgi:hypothetical protein
MMSMPIDPMQGRGRLVRVDRIVRDRAIEATGAAQASGERLGDGKTYGGKPQEPGKEEPGKDSDQREPEDVQPDQGSASRDTLDFFA